MIAIMEVVLGLLSGISDPIAKAFGEWMQSSLPRFLAKPCTENRPWNKLVPWAIFCVKRRLLAG